jgi:hypothetical protein
MWNADTDNSGGFEAKTLDDLSWTIANHYAENMQDLPSINLVYYENAHSARSTLSTIGIVEFTESCEVDFQNEIEEIQAEDNHRDQVRSDYLANLL